MPTEAEKLITVASPNSPVSEAYRALRTNILFATFDKPARSIAVTSTSQDEGKTTIVANLAVAFSQAGKRVVLVDADLRRPSLHTLFGLPNERGVTSAFIGEAAASLSADLQDSGVANLRLLTSGPLPPNPSEILGSQRMSVLIGGLAELADYVLFDCPPILAVTDAAILGHQVDGVLLVVSANKTKRDGALKAKQLLEKVNANILGVVLNNAKLDSSVFRYYGQR